MEKYNYAIQVSDNVTDVMDLPCVMRCDKLVMQYSTATCLQTVRRQ